MEFLKLLLGFFGKDVKLFGYVITSKTIRKVYTAIAALAKGFKNDTPDLIKTIYFELLEKWDDVKSKPDLLEFLTLQDKAINALWKALH
jgi:hypothetical protein